MKAKSIFLVGLSMTMLAGCGKTLKADVASLEVDQKAESSRYYGNKKVYTGLTVDSSKKKYDSITAQMIGVVKNKAPKTSGETGGEAPKDTFSAFNLMTGKQIGSASEEQPSIMSNNSVYFVKIRKSTNSYAYYFMDGTLLTSWEDTKPAPSVSVVSDSINSKLDEETNKMKVVKIVSVDEVKFKVEYEYDNKYGSLNFYEPKVSSYSEEEIFVNHTPNVSHPVLIYDDLEEEDQYSDSDIESYFYTKHTNWTGDITKYEFYKPSSKKGVPDPEPISSLELVNKPSKNISYVDFTFFGDYLFYKELTNASNFYRVETHKKSEYKLHRFNIKTGKSTDLGSDLFIQDLTIIKNNKGKHNIAYIKGNTPVEGKINERYRGVKLIVNQELDIVADLSLSPFQDITGLYKLKENRYLVESGRSGVFIVDNSLNLIADLSIEEGHMESIKLIPEHELVAVRYEAIDYKSYYAMVSFDGEVTNNDTYQAAALFEGSKVFAGKYLYTDRYGNERCFDLKTGNSGSMSWVEIADSHDSFPSLGLIATYSDTTMTVGEKEYDVSTIGVFDYSQNQVDSFSRCISSANTVMVGEKAIVYARVNVVTEDELGVQTISEKSEVHIYSLAH